jgi:hypothetical protein
MWTAEHLLVMFKLLVILLDLTLMFLVSLLVSSNTPTLVSFGIGIVVTTRVLLNTMVPHPHDPKIPPATAINALLQPTQTPQGDRCPVCLADFFEPRKLSCNHVFCRDCALLMLCKQDTCPLCQQVPTQQGEVDKVLPFALSVGVLLFLVVGWLRNCIVLSVAWVVPCLWQLRLPTRSEMMLAVMRATIQLALRTTIADIVPFIPCFRTRRDQRSKLVDTIANIGTFAITLSYDYAARVYLPLCVVLAAVQYSADFE